MNSTIIKDVEARLRSVPDHKFKASNGIQLLLDSDGDLDVRNADGGTKCSVGGVRDAIEEFRTK